MWILIGVTAALLVCDRVLKALARSEKLRYRGKLLQLTHLENPGFFLGKGSRYPGSCGGYRWGSGYWRRRCCCPMWSGGRRRHGWASC